MHSRLNVCHCSVEMFCLSGTLGGHIKTQSGCHQCKIRNCCRILTHKSGALFQLLWIFCCQNNFCNIEPIWGKFSSFSMLLTLNLYFIADYSWQRMTFSHTLWIYTKGKLRWAEEEHFNGGLTRDTAQDCKYWIWQHGCMLFDWPFAVMYNVMYRIL